MRSIGENLFNSTLKAHCFLNVKCKRQTGSNVQWPPTALNTRDTIYHYPNWWPAAGVISIPGCKSLVCDKGLVNHHRASYSSKRLLGQHQLLSQCTAQYPEKCLLKQVEHVNFFPAAQKPAVGCFFLLCLNLVYSIVLWQTVLQFSLISTSYRVPLAAFLSWAHAKSFWPSINSDTTTDHQSNHLHCPNQHTFIMFKTAQVNLLTAVF